MTEAHLGRWDGPRSRLVVALVLLVAGVAGCRGRTAPVAGTNVAAGDALYGRLPASRPSQSFTFEGVESSVLDLDLVSDEPSLAAPQICLLDPEGKRIPLAPYTRSPEGAATTQIRDVVLLRTGTYQVTVAPTIPCHPVFYRFCHQLRFPSIECMPVTLNSCEPHPVYVSAPRGGMVTVQIRPKPGASVAPHITAVEDPWGGRALDPARLRRPATIHEGQGGAIFLNFTAAIPGRYKVVASAKNGTCGPAFVSTRVAPPPCPVKSVMHPNRAACDFGIPAAESGIPAAGSASDTDLPR